MKNRPEINDINTNRGLVHLGTIPNSAPVAVFNVDGIENLLDTKGIQAYHYKCAIHPARESIEGGVNVKAQGLTRGFIYYEIRQLLIVPTSLKLDVRFTVQGLFDVNSCVLNVAGNYSDGEKDPVFLRPNDLIVLNKTITIPHNQIVEYSPTSPIKTHYRVVAVEYLASENIRYEQGVDFNVINGMIVWTDHGRKPSHINGKGEILTLVYHFNPVYIVQNVPHALRIIPSNPMGNANFPRHAKYAPQLAVAISSHLSQQQGDFFHLPDYREIQVSPNHGGSEV